MRNITKIFLLLVVAFVAYCIWPRSSSLKDFKPAEMAALQIRNWQAQKSGQSFGALVARYKVYRSQYNFAPITAFRLAQAQGGAMSKIGEVKKDEADSVAENRALGGLTEKYSMMKEAVHGDFDPDALAREEFGWRVTEQDPADSAAVVVPSMSRIFAGLYGGKEEDFTEAATDIAKARALVLSGGDVAEAQEAAKEGFALLHEIAGTAPTAEQTPAP